MGCALLADAVTRAILLENTVYALLVDARDETAAGFYHHHDFVTMPDSPLMLFLPLASIRVLHAGRYQPAEAKSVHG